MEKFRKIIGVLLILIGVGIIGTVAYKKIVTSQKQNELLEAFESQLAEGDNENTEEEVNLDSINGYTPIAIMEIPESTMPGEVGNFAVAGHRVSDFTDAFINLYKVKPGDNVIVTTKDGKYTYEVEESFIVDPEQVEVLENADYEKITLITCTIGSKRRVIVTGKLIEKNEA